MRIRVHLLLIVGLLAASLPVHASPWYPVETGRLWVYSGETIGQVSAIVESPEEFAGTLAYPLHWNAGAREYFSQDADGRILFHGLIYPDGASVVFDPPILRMDSDLKVDHEWETVTNAIHYDAAGIEVLREQARSVYHVIAIGPVDVPAGSFTGIEIARTEETGPATRAALSSSAVLPPSSLPDDLAAHRLRYSFRDTYAEGVGWIRQTDEAGSTVLLELEAYGVNGVETEHSSWGPLKARFGN